MKTKKEIVERIKKNHGGDIDSVIAWAAGYINSLEDKANDMRELLNSERERTLYESISAQIDSEEME